MSSLAVIILQMKFKFTLPKAYLDDLHALQRGNSDTRIISDIGEILIHRAALQIYGEAIWWTSLLTEPGLNVVLLPGVSQVELHSFVDTIYGRYQEEAEVRAKACRAPPSVLLQAEHKEDIETVVFEQIGSGPGATWAAGGLVTPQATLYRQVGGVEGGGERWQVVSSGDIDTGEAGPVLIQRTDGQQPLMIISHP